MPSPNFTEKFSKICPFLHVQIKSFWEVQDVPRPTGDINLGSKVVEEGLVVVPSGPLKVPFILIVLNVALKEVVFRLPIFINIALSDAPEISDSSRLTSRIFRMLSSAICLCLRCLSTLKSKFYFFLFATTKYQTSVDWRCQNYLRVPNVNRLTFTKFTIYRPLIKIENKLWHKCNL